MPSSTSSSDEHRPSGQAPRGFERRLPQGPWGAVWLVAVLLAVGLTGMFEHVARSHHQRPSVVDDAVWWSVYRRTIDDDPRVVALIGTSRMGLAVSPAAFAEVAPERRAVQLAINGMLAFAPFEDVANDEAFRGVAVVDFAEWELDRDDAFSSAAAYVERSHELWRAPGALANRDLASYAQSELAVLAVGGRELIASVLGSRRWPAPKWVAGDRDRALHGDYGLADEAALAKRREKAIHGFPAVASPPDAWLAKAARLEPLVAKIRARGGTVVFLRMGVSGQLAQLAEQRYPRAQYWDAFSRASSAVTIFARDVPELAPLECPDFMHLDQRDQAAFTRGLVAELRRRQVLTTR